MSNTLRTYESDTPETCEAVERWQQGKINIFDEMARLERERDQWKDIAERSIGYVYDNDWDPEACDIIKDYEKLAGGPHPIHSR
jgi:hypothetical protein